MAVIVLLVMALGAAVVLLHVLDAPLQAWVATMSALASLVTITATHLAAHNALRGAVQRSSLPAATSAFAALSRNYRFLERHLGRGVVPDTAEIQKHEEHISEAEGSIWMLPLNLRNHFHQTWQEQVRLLEICDALRSTLPVAMDNGSAPEGEGSIDGRSAAIREHWKQSVKDLGGRQRALEAALHEHYKL
ncbi:MAG: hypothetical protein H6711_31205 [Myxococcales bacterium]|nr:hypothetical protein [Myxococcales bacterium]